MSHELFYLYDEKENTTTRYVSFMGETSRHDLVITITEKFYGKKLVINMQTNRAALIGDDDLKEEGYLEFAFGISPEEAEELLTFFHQLS